MKKIFEWIKAKLNIHSVVRCLLYEYVNWERMWYEPKEIFKAGDQVRLNWRGRVTFPEVNKNLIMTVKSTDYGGVVDTIENSGWSSYWLQKVKQRTT